jgi:RNA polymerase sigma-70 factor (ECF subfamily)
MANVSPIHPTDRRPDDLPFPPGSPGARGTSGSAARGDDGPADGAQMARVAAGDRDAFATVYARHAPPIMSFLAHTLGDCSTAEDLCQETFVRAWRAAPRFRGDAPLAPWLFRIARNLSHTELRRRRRAQSGIGRLFFAREPVGDDDAGRDPSPDAGPGARSDLGTALSSAVGRLSERLRSAFVLVRMEGLSYEDAARLLDVPVGTVKSRASAAEVELRRRLASYRPEGAS